MRKAISGTNAGGNLVIRDSVWDDNGSGILPNTQDSEALAPQHQVTIVDNLVYDNNNINAPFDRLEYSISASASAFLAAATI